LSSDTYYSVVREIRALLGWNYNTTTNDRLVLTMETAMKPYGELKVLSFSEVRQILKDQGINTDNNSIKEKIKFFYE